MKDISKMPTICEACKRQSKRDTHCTHAMAEIAEVQLQTREKLESIEHDLQLAEQQERKALFQQVSVKLIKLQGGLKGAFGDVEIDLEKAKELTDAILKASSDYAKGAQGK